MSARAERLLDLAYDAIFTFSLADDRITYWNRGAELTYGFTAAEAIGRRPEELLRSFLDAARSTVVTEVVERGSWEGRIVQRRRDGRPLVVDARWQLERDDAGAAVGILEVNRDVTDQWFSEAEAELILDAIDHTGIARLDAEGRIRRWNRGAEQIFGWSEAEVLGQPLPAGISLELGQRERWLPRREGRIWVELSVYEAKDPTDKRSGLVLVARELTEPRRAAERQRAHEQAKSEFLNLGAHELRSPVTVIAGYLSMLAEGTIGAPDQETLRVVAMLRAKVGELSDMVEEMVEVARLAEGTVQLNVETVELNQLVAEAVDTAALLAGPRHRLAVELGSVPVLVSGDRRRLQLILSNLLANAVRFSPEGGTVECRVRAAQEVATVEVEDRAGGIPPGDVERLFKRFEPGFGQRGAAPPGSGPGLYLARALARLHGGDVSVRSRRDRGSVFRLSLPRERRRAVHQSA